MSKLVCTASVTGFLIHAAVILMRVQLHQCIDTAGGKFLLNGKLGHHLSSRRAGEGGGTAGGAANALSLHPLWQPACTSISAWHIRGLQISPMKTCAKQQAFMVLFQAFHPAGSDHDQNLPEKGSAPECRKPAWADGEVP